jgi:1-acyl-sn-glycerol-3-phosphate acyltransferase
MTTQTADRHEPDLPAILQILTHLRSIVGIAFVVPFTFICSIICITAGAFHVRQFATEIMRAWGIILLYTFGIRVQVKGEKNLPEVGGGIIVFNHQSHFDIPVLVSTTRKNIRFGAKIELFKIPFFGPAMRAVGTLPIARESRSEVLRVYKEAEKKFAENYIFVLAPEGTRQKEPKIGRFKKGPFGFAINAGVPIIPAVLRGAYAVLPKNSLSINVGKLRRTIYVEFLPPIPTKDLKPESVEALAEKTRSEMEKAYF